MDNPEILATVRENQRGNQEWTIQRYWQQLEKTDGAIKNGQSRNTGNSYLVSCLKNNPDMLSPSSFMFEEQS